MFFSSSKLKIHFGKDVEDRTLCISYSFRCYCIIRTCTFRIQACGVVYNIPKSNIFLSKLTPLSLVGFPFPARGLFRLNLLQKHFLLTCFRRYSHGRWFLRFAITLGRTAHSIMFSFGSRDSSLCRNGSRLSWYRSTTTSDSAILARIMYVWLEYFICDLWVVLCSVPLLK